MCGKPSETMNRRKRTLNMLLLFLIGPFKANSGFAYLFPASYSIYWFEIYRYRVYRENTFQRAMSNIQESAKWSV